MSKLTKALTAAAGNAGGDPLYAEDVFSTYLYDGTGAAHTITNGIDLDGEGGLTWIKTRNTGTSAWHSLSDTERGAGYILRSDLINAQNFDTAEFTSFNSDGFTVGNDAQTNGSGRTYASWTFRKAKKFFDVVTYTGDGTADRQIPHNINGTVGAILIKQTSASLENWVVYHRSNGATGALYLNDTRAFLTADSFFNDTDPTSTNFTISNTYAVNRSGYSYVAYLFASDAGGFGDDGDENIIKCGSYTGNGSADGPEIDLGFEAQWVMIKRTDASGNDWVMMDIMRGMPADSGGAYLRANLSNNEAATAYMQPTPTGLKVRGTGSTQANASGATYIYIAIRRPMKTPESGTEVFALDTEGSAGSLPGYRSGFPVDMMIRPETGGGSFPTSARLIQKSQLVTNGTNAETGFSSLASFDYMNGFSDVTGVASNRIGYMFKRATGFMDVVAYTGNGTAGTTQAHNLGVAPEMMWIKRRDSSGNWVALIDDGNGDLYKYQYLQTNEAFATSSSFVTANDSSSFTLGSNGTVNATNGKFIAYLFATLAGVSKVGSYTGTGSDLNVDCGFTAGARFILIKRTDSTGDWYVWDSVRGITAGNDPYLLLNSTAAEVTNTDYIDPLSSGFTVTSSAPAALNASGGNYIFLAIA